MKVYGIGFQRNSIASLNLEIEANAEVIGVGVGRSLRLRTVGGSYIDVLLMKILPSLSHTIGYSLLLTGCYGR